MLIIVDIFSMRRILIVEDDKFISTILSMFLKSLGHQLVAECIHGKDVLDACRIHKPDVVLMDIHLDGEWDGVFTCQMMRSEFDIPVIYISSEAENHIVERAVTSNSYGYLVKPITKQELGISIDLAYFKHKADAMHRERENNYRDFISNTHSAIIIVNKGNIQYLNNFALGVFKTTYIEDLLMNPFLHYVGENLKQEVQLLIDRPFNDDRWVKTLEGTMHTIHGDPYSAELTISAVMFGGSRVLQFSINDKSSNLVPLTYINLMKKALLAYPRLCLVLSQNLEIQSFNPVFERLPLERKNQIVKFLSSAQPNQLAAGSDELMLPMATADGLLWLKVFIARNPKGEPMEYIVMEVDA